MCEGLNSQLNIGGWLPWDLTASAKASGDGVSILVRSTKGGSLEYSRDFHSTHKLVSPKPEKRKGVSVGA